MASADDVAADLDAFLETAVKAVILEVNHELVATTPVDTGFARASWVPSVGTPSSATGASAAASGMAELAAYKLSDGMAFESNNAAYIEALNRGHSKQAPAQFVEMAIEKGVHRATVTLNDGSLRDQGGRFV